MSFEPDEEDSPETDDDDKVKKTAGMVKRASNKDKHKIGTINKTMQHLHLHDPVEFPESKSLYKSIAEKDDTSRIYGIPIALQVLLNMMPHYSIEFNNLLQGPANSIQSRELTEREMFRFSDLVSSVVLHSVYKKKEDFYIPKLPPVLTFFKELRTSFRLQLRVGLLLKHREKSFEKADPIDRSIPIYKQMARDFSEVRLYYEEILEKI